MQDKVSCYLYVFLTIWRCSLCTERSHNSQRSGDCHNIKYALYVNDVFQGCSYARHKMLLLNFGSSCSGRSISEQWDGRIPLKKKKCYLTFVQLEILWLAKRAQVLVLCQSLEVIETKQDQDWKDFKRCSGLWKHIFPAGTSLFHFCCSWWHRNKTLRLERACVCTCYFV